MRNWFPGYKYESFVLDTYDDELKGCAFEESGSGLDGCSAVRESCSGKGDLGANNKVLDLLSSESTFSEPPHVRNWFSSYGYESPALHTIVDDYRRPDLNKNNCKKDVLANEGSKREREENIQEQGIYGNSNEASASENLWLDGFVAQKSLLEEACEKSLDKITDSSQSSFLSEPPDLRNWLSSYVYESPMLDENDVFVHDQTECNEEDLLGKDGIKEKQMILPKATDENQENQSLNERNAFDREEIQSAGRDSPCKMGRTEFPNHSLSSTRSILNDDISQHNKPAAFLSIKSNVKPITNCSTSLKRLIHGNDIREKVGGGAQPEDDDLGSSEASKEAAHEGDDDKENQSKRFPENGFVTTRKSPKPTAENPPNRPQGVLPECRRDSRSALFNYAMDATARRNVLSERTNLEHHDAVGVTGKWHCPQKKKPVVEPPLKQLRLERWVHRI